MRHILRAMTTMALGVALVGVSWWIWNSQHRLWSQANATDALVLSSDVEYVVDEVDPGKPTTAWYPRVSRIRAEKDQIHTMDSIMGGLR